MSYRPARLLLLAAALPAMAQQPAAAPRRGAPASLAAILPLDPAVRAGTLPNGLRYYVRRNAKPEKRAELRLVVNAGSVLETDAQLGYAHFIEHTAFNGTTHFAKNDLVSYLQSVGVQFGADLNASTSFDETVYILPVPTDSAAIVSTAFEILDDWAHGQTFDSAQVAGERSVVREEWRGRKGAYDRTLRQIVPVALRGSRYAARLPIGTEASIMAARPAVLEAFYRTWYRPDLMAVIAVGDFDPAAIEREIRTRFADIPRAANPQPRPVITVPRNRAPLVVVATDDELTTTTVEVTFKARPDTTRTVGDYRRDLIAELYTTMLNARLAEIAQRPDAPFLEAQVSRGEFFVRNASGFDLVAGVSEGGVERGLEALLLETKRVDAAGFLPSELSRARQDLLRSYERAFAERDKTSSRDLVEEYVANYLQGEAAPGIDVEYPLVQRLLPAITLGDVNRAARSWITSENRVVVVTGPRKTGVRMPTERGLLAVFDRAARTPVTAYAEHVSGAALVPHPPTPGSVMSERTIPGTDITEWMLSNGARVLVKATDFKADEILFSAWAFGGTSLAANEDYMSASLAAQLASLGGVGAFSRVDLAKKLSGKAVQLQPSVGETTEGLGGSASPKDLETLMQLAYLQFTAPRRDTLAFQAFRNQVAPILRNRGSDPDAVFGDTVNAVMSRHDFRSRPLSPATFGEVSLDRALTFYRDRFADASGFTFTFVGNVDRATLKRLVERYLASLPSAGRRERWRAVRNPPPTGVLDVAVRKGAEDKATTLIVFTGPFDFTPENRFALRALTEYLQIKLVETLRERLGGTYSPDVGQSASRIPRPEYMVQVSFSSSPTNVDTLTPAVYALIDTLARVGPSAADVEKVKAQMARQRETDLKQNGYWLANIVARSQNEEDIAGFGAAYDRMIAGLAAADIQAAARHYLDMNTRARFVLLPEKP